MEAPPVFEQGPIRPPSEARSLLLRVTRNCTWNKCEFCPVYKGEKFSKRSVEEVKDDVRAIAYWLDVAVQTSRQMGFGGRLDEDSIPAIYGRAAANPYLRSLLIWLSGGGTTAFLQDANNLAHKPEDLAAILMSLRETFPQISRVTSYARSSTAAKWGVEDLARVREAGLNRIHVGLESGSDKVLQMVSKGVTQEAQVEAGNKIRAAGMELSEYVMPGLGGRALSGEHARETARALNLVNPHFIRLRSLGLREGMPLYERVKSGEFEIMNDIETAREIRLFIDSLDGIDSMIVSDHILNLLPEVEGKLPRDKDKMLSVIDHFLDLPEEDQLVYVVGRRFGWFESVDDLDNPSIEPTARRALSEIKSRSQGDAHAVIREIVSQFI